MTSSVDDPTTTGQAPAIGAGERRVEFVHSFLQAITAKGSGSRKAIDPYLADRFARTLDDYGFDHTLLGYSSDGADPFVVASRVLARTTRLKTIVALRPNICYPTVAAQALATLDHLGRYARSAEYIEILHRAWTEDAPFDHEGEHYRFEGFGPGSQPLSGGSLPISIGGVRLVEVVALSPLLRVAAAGDDVHHGASAPLSGFEPVAPGPAG
jgi:hypothetical protein